MKIRSLHLGARVRAIVLPSALLAFAIPAFAAPLYRVDAIPALPDGAVAQSLSPQGIITVNYWESDRLTIGLIQDGQFSPLALPPGSDMAFSAQANERGQVLSAGYTRKVMLSEDGKPYNDVTQYQPFLHDKGVNTLLSTTLNGRPATYHKLNDAGDVLGAVMLGDASSPSAYQPFIFHSSTGQTDLLGPSLSLTGSGPYPGDTGLLNINNAGQVFAVRSSAAGSELLAVEGEATRSLFTADGAISIRGVNDAGEVLFDTSAPSVHELYLYGGGEVVRLGQQRFIPGNGHGPTEEEMYGHVETDGFVMATHLMEDGTVLGRDKSSRHVLHKDGQTHFLDDLLDPVTGKDAGIWEVSDVDSAGRILARGRLDRSVVLTPMGVVPEPGAMSLFAIGLLAMGAVAKRRPRGH